MMESVFTSILLEIPTVLIHGLARKAQLEPWVYAELQKSDAFQKPNPVLSVDIDPAVAAGVAAVAGVPAIAGAPAGDGVPAAAGASDDLLAFLMMQNPTWEGNTYPHQPHIKLPPSPVFQIQYIY
jgi:hypothetical protein